MRVKDEVDAANYKIEEKIPQISLKAKRQAASCDSANSLISSKRVRNDHLGGTNSRSQSTIDRNYSDAPQSPDRSSLGSDDFPDSKESSNSRRFPFEFRGNHQSNAASAYASPYDRRISQRQEDIYEKIAQKMIQFLGTSFHRWHIH